MSISTLRRQVKNVALNYTDAQVKVREATSNDPWGPTTALMSEVADMTHNPMQFTEIMSMIWKRLNDHGKNWRHVYKSLVLLDYLIKCGSERVAQQCKENIFSIETLKDFQHIEENRDQGLNVRTKAKQMVTLLGDEEKLKNERARFMLTRKRFIQNGSLGISSDGTTRRSGVGRRQLDDSAPYDPDFEEARPSSLGEEEMQLQIALALSREECEKEHEMRKGDDIRLQIAIEESRRELMARSSSLSSPAGGVDPSQKPSTSKSQGALDNLLSLGLDEIFSQQNGGSVAAAAGPSSSAQAFANDPWATPRPSTTIPMVSAGGRGAAIGGEAAFGILPVHAAAKNDPWATPAGAKPKLNANQEVDDILSMSPPAVSNSIVHNDPWASFDNNTGAALVLEGHKQGGEGEALFGQEKDSQGTNIGQQRSNVKTPETFLGENSSLVNLDNLLGPSNFAQPKKATNPFLVGSAASTAAVAAASKNNPFASNQTPSPSLHEMLQAKQQGPVGGAAAAAGTGPSTSTAPAAEQQTPFDRDGSLI